ncbi:MAG: hypothetical protein M3Q48_12250, partial [Actinomycetota bacterium]|nr:hypothetical protein [Actinomycetota bacterium]
MGWCHEFGAQVREGCDHPMQAGVGACSCAVCGTACNGRFAGCDLVWARGPRPVVRVRPAGAPSGNGREATATPAPPPTDGPGHPGHPDDLARLLAAVDDLRHDVAALAATFASRSEALDQSSTRLVELVEDLPLRIGAAVRTALQAHAGNGAPVPG